MLIRKTRNTYYFKFIIKKKRFNIKKVDTW